MPDQSHENTLHLIHAHIDILDHTPIEHTCGNMPITTLLLKFAEAPEEDSFTVCETISGIW